MPKSDIRRFVGESLTEQERLDLLEQLAAELYQVHGGCTVAVGETGASVHDSNGNIVDEITFQEKV